MIIHEIEHWGVTRPSSETYQVQTFYRLEYSFAPVKLGLVSIEGNVEYRKRLLRLIRIETSDALRPVSGCSEYIHGYVGRVDKKIYLPSDIARFALQKNHPLVRFISETPMTYHQKTSEGV